MRNKGFNAPYFKGSVDKQKELFNVVNNVPHYYEPEARIKHLGSKID